MKRSIDPIAKKGMRIRMIHMDDERPVDEGMEGTIRNVDDMGTIHVTWDDGRNLGVVPNVDEYELLPSEGDQIDFDVFEDSGERLMKKISKKPISGSINKTFKKAYTKNNLKAESENDSEIDYDEVLGLMKSKGWGGNISNHIEDFESSDYYSARSIYSTNEDPTMNYVETFHKYMYDLSTGSNEIEGGVADGMTIKDIAKKHNVPIGDIKKELKIGTKIELEHTDSRKKAKEIAMDHLVEFPDYYSNEEHGLVTSEKKLEKDKDVDLEETTTAGAAGAYNAPLFGKQTTIKKPKVKKTSSKIVTKGDLKNPLGKIYSFKPKTESKVFKAGDLLSEISSTHASKLRAAEGTYDGDPWVGKKGWLRKDELVWKGGKIADILAKLDINWNDTNLSLTDKETDAINEGWLFKTKEDKLVLSILKRVKERYPDNVKLDRGYRGGENDLPHWGSPITFTLPGIKREAKIYVKCWEIPYDGSTACSLQVNYRDLDASKWAIKKLYNFFFEKLHNETKLKLDREIKADLTDPSFAEDVFDMLDEENIVSEGKKKKEKESPIHKKKWERCVKDVEKKNKENKTDYNPYAVCTASIGYEGSIKKPHRRKDKEDIEETTTFSSVFGSGYPVTPFMFAKKGKHIPSKKPIWKGGKIVQKANKADLLGEANKKFSKANLLDEINKVKWVKGGKYVKIKDRCAKYNNKPWCSQGAIDNPLELSDTTFENIKKVSKKMNISEGDILDKIKAKLKGVSKKQMEYNKEHGLPIWWQGSKEGFYEYMEPRKNNTGSN